MSSFVSLQFHENYKYLSLSWTAGIISPKEAIQGINSFLLFSQCTKLKEQFTPGWENRTVITHTNHLPAHLLLETARASKGKPGDGAHAVRTLEAKYTMSPTRADQTVETWGVGTEEEYAQSDKRGPDWRTHLLIACVVEARPSAHNSGALQQSLLVIDGQISRSATAHPFHLFSPTKSSIRWFDCDWEPWTFAL